MLAEQFGNLVKAQRDRSGIKQAELASLAKVSRSVLSRLESGKGQPVQTNVLDRLFAALDISPCVLSGATPDWGRMQARLEHQRKLDERRNRHLRLAVDLASGEMEAPAKIAKALERVELWQSKRSCSPFYIKRWRTLLRLSPRDLARAMASLGVWEDAMFQNSPWSWVWS
jgi:transcriptional regulator with XRE-family HTH domain